MLKWRIVEFLMALVALVCLVLAGSLLLSDGGDVAQFRRTPDVLSKELVNPIDWEKLKKINPNIYAWVCVPGTKIDYPVLQAGKEQEEDFYLHHNFENKYEFAGAIYSRRDNSKTFEDPVTVLYGHNMINGSMFADVKKFEGAGFFANHDTLYIYLPDRILTYQIVSFFQTGSADLLSAYHPEDKAGFERYRDFILAEQGGNRRNGIRLNEKDHVLTLSTCSSIGNGRRLLHAVRVEEQLTPPSAEGNKIISQNRERLFKEKRRKNV